MSGGIFFDYSADDVIGRADVPLVSILTYCQHPAMLYGTLLTFKTLRVGFPTAEVEVWDNGSLPELRDEIRAAAEAAGARFTAMPGRHHTDHLRWLLLKRPAASGRTLVLADPDLVFYEDVERWDFAGYLMAGRLMPAMRNPGIVTRARLHTSLLYVPCVQSLRRALPDEGLTKWSAIGGMVRDKSGRVAWDSLAPVYSVVQRRCKVFTPAQLDAFSHLFLGTHLGAVNVHPDAGGAVLYDAHRAAAVGDLDALRGIWRRQENYFRSESPFATDRSSGPLPKLRAMQEWQGMSFADDHLEQAARRIQGRLTIRPALAHLLDRKAEPEDSPACLPRIVNLRKNRQSISVPSVDPPRFGGGHRE